MLTEKVSRGRRNVAVVCGRRGASSAATRVAGESHKWAAISDTEMADIILNALRSIEGVPARGFVVTVYGTNPWSAMLTIKPEAGRIKDAQLWRERVQDIGLVYERTSTSFTSTDQYVAAAKGF